jgi:LPXTG-site transpeptidase (sortase) family protein
MIPVGVRGDNSINIPENVSTVGWYKHGAAPGSKGGSVVIVGHRDDTDPEPGAFYSINKLKKGHMIIIEYNNYTLFYTVKYINLIDKNMFYKISNKVFSLTGKPKLRLISCIGPYNKKWGGYKQNIIVTAEPLTKYPWMHYNININDL